MTWFATADPSLPPFEGWLAHRPELRDLYKRFYGAPWDSALVPRHLLELCRLRIAALHACEAELAVTDPGAGLSEEQRGAIGDWERATCFTPAQRAALALAEKMPWRHHDIDDSEFAEARRHLSDPQIVALTVAMALFDANCRLRIVFDLAPSPSRAVPAATGPLH